MTHHKTFTSEQAARRFIAAIDAAEGLPRQESPETGARRVGRGPHTPWEQVRTETHARPRKHPARNEWAVPVTEMATRHEGMSIDPGDGGAPVIIDTSDATELGESWRPDPGPLGTKTAIRGGR